MGNPEQVGRTLHQMGIALERRSGMSAFQYRHHITTYGVAILIHHLILFPEGACCFGVTSSERPHRPLQQGPDLSSKSEDTLQNRSLGKLNIHASSLSEVAFPLFLLHRSTRLGNPYRTEWQHTQHVLRHTLSLISDPFEINRHWHKRREVAQIPSGQRLLQAQDPEGMLFNR